MLLPLPFHVSKKWLRMFKMCITLSSMYKNWTSLLRHLFLDAPLFIENCKPLKSLQTTYLKYTHIGTGGKSPKRMSNCTYISRYGWQSLQGNMKLHVTVAAGNDVTLARTLRDHVADSLALVKVSDHVDVALQQASSWFT